MWGITELRIKKLKELKKKTKFGVKVGGMKRLGDI